MHLVPGRGRIGDLWVGQGPESRFSWRPAAVRQGAQRLWRAGETHSGKPSAVSGDELNRPDRRATGQSLFVAIWQGLHHHRR